MDTSAVIALGIAAGIVIGVIVLLVVNVIKVFRKNSNRVIGLSLSFCIADISRGMVNEDDVDKIITSTKCATDEDWAQVLEQYSKTYWDHDPEACTAIANRLYKAEKIDQPRLRGERPNYVGQFHWMKPGETRPELNW